MTNACEAASAPRIPAFTCALEGKNVINIHAFTCAVEGKNVINILTYKPAILSSISNCQYAVNAESVNDRSTADNPHSALSNFDEMQSAVSGHQSAVNHQSTNEKFVASNKSPKCNDEVGTVSLVQSETHRCETCTDTFAVPDLMSERPEFQPDKRALEQFSVSGSTIGERKKLHEEIST